MDRVVIEDLLVRGIVGINAEERVNRQDVVVGVTMWVDASAAAASDDISDAVNYRTVSKRIIEHVETGSPQLVERLADEIAHLCLDADDRVRRVEVSVRKPGAVRFARSVGVIVTRQRDGEAPSP